MLDVTGNNISNVNTTGFKKDTTIFADIMYQSSKYASGAGAARGGINPAQVGLGVSVSAIETVHTQGSAQYTGNNSDMMIQDKGFFVYADGNTQLFSRSGALTLDNNSDMVMSGTGYKLQGYQYEKQPATGEYEQASSLSTINIPLGQKIDASATTRVDYQCNLDSRSDAYLSYGFADMPFNVGAGWGDNSSGTARIDINGTTYDMSFVTDFEATANANNTGVNYLNVTMVNGDAEAVLTFDMIGVNGDTGLPELSLPSISYDGTDYHISYVPEPDDPATSNYFVGWLSNNNDFVSTVDEIGEAITAANVIDADEINKTLDTYTPVYQFPGQTPPQYFAVQYDDDSGSMRLRQLTFTDADGNDISSQATTAGLAVDLAENGNLDGAAIKANLPVFTYNIKENMNYTSFKLEGAPTILTPDQPANGEAVSLKYNFIAEFHESVMEFDAGNTPHANKQDTPSELGKTSSKMTLWYYGYSNADAANYVAGTATQTMHKLDATVFFNADGTFDSVDWEIEDNNNPNANAPLGYRIVDGTVPDGEGGTTTAGPNFQIAPGTASAASTKIDTLKFMQAKSLDTPGSLDSTGLWTTQGSVTQGGYHSTKLTIYDDNGKQHTLEVSFKKVTENRWRWEAFLVEQDETSGEYKLANIIPSPNTGEIEFDGSGRISNAVAASNDNPRRGTGNTTYPNAEVELTIPFSLEGTPNSVVTLNFGGGVGKGGTALEGVTQFASETTTKPVYQDGYTMGVLKNYSVSYDGTITGSYDNGINIPMYRVALATFANEQGLEKVGDSMFQASVNSGNANIDGATSNGKGKIVSQNLEMSNVDLTEEFTHLIIAQRGFQANTRVVTVSDQILEEVVNLKR